MRITSARTVGCRSCASCTSRRWVSVGCPGSGTPDRKGGDEVTETIGIAADLRAESAVSRPSRRIAVVQLAPSGGLFQFSLQLGEALARGGNQVELITGPSPERGSREPGCHVNTALPTWHPTAGANAPQWWRRIRRGLRAIQYIGAWCVLLVQLLRSRPDVVIWSAWQFPVDGWGVHLVRKTLPHSVLAMLAHEPRGRAGQLGGQRWALGITARALCRAYADLDVAFVLGESTKRALIESWPVTAPVHVIPHGDSGLVLSGCEIPGAATTAPVALSFGTLTAYKGIDTLCEAWPLVRQEVPNAKLMIVGALGADMARSTLTAAVEALDGVVLRIGYVPLEDVPALFARARCVVLPYKQSSQSGVAHLAHTLRRPVVATTVGDIPAVIEDGTSGLLVPPDRPDALAGALVELLTDSAAADRMGEAGAAALAAAGSWDVIADRVGAALVSQGAAQGSRPCR
ncbi:glycosyltransferase family 4 protein [Mycobacterium sp. ITM-2016-00317]|uniref:glycosyltransferase family 4 protein n=1 Tax=Mycobacterium sp. ITM-2016-00317 TaxID=2099694 RepID=UPI00287F9FB1|nr:glycosyltransferase family 4 protein [Mycobacterium sp. ITM-2016-00317]WNG86964.1 glycosyltransferase family 4 protein [Mycobacterium sp. ITM-2016-00317]